MDDMSPELRLVVEAARASRLTRADKARLWRRLEQHLDDSMRGETPTKPKRPRVVVSAFPRHVFAGACVLLLALGVAHRGPSVEERPLVSTVVPSLAVQPTMIPETLVLAPVPTDGTRRRPSSVAKRVPGSVQAPKYGAMNPALAAMVPAPAALTPVTVEATLGAQEASVRIQPARTRILETKPGTPAVGSSRSAPLRVSDDFREKLVAENLARYQAAIAEHARIASIRRPLSSVGGYAAW